jgi:AGZA family xanthine/uracil permease-like MFS transporter
MSAPDVSKAAEDIALGIPNFEFGLLGDGLAELSPLLATAIPLGIYNFSEAMSNVESAAAAGDDYNLRHVLLADGTGAIVGSTLGCPFPPAVYIGQPGWKEAGGRISYSLATGVIIFLLCTLGMFPLLSALLPIPAIVPVLLFIGLVIGAQAFSAVPRAHYPAIVLAMVPNIAAWGAGLVDNALSAAGTSSAKVGSEALNGAGVVTDGLHTLGHGAVLAGMVLGAIAVFMIDRRFVHAAIACAVAGLLTLVGLIHGEEVVWFTSEPRIALGYGFAGLVCVGLYAMRVPVRERDPADPNDVPEEAPVRVPRTEVPTVGREAPALA